MNTATVRRAPRRAAPPAEHPTLLPEAVPSEALSPNQTLHQTLHQHASAPGQSGLPDLAAVLHLFDETTGALSAQVHRLESILTAKHAELQAANAKLTAANAELARQADERARLAARLHLVMSSVSAGVLAIDALGLITTCNDAGITALAANLPDPLGASYADAFPASPLLAVLADGKPRRWERSVRGPDGRVRIHAVSGAPIRGDAGHEDAIRSASDRDPHTAPEPGAISGAVEVFEDITELRRLHEAAERADRLAQLGAMAAGVAHEIRNPLNGIAGFASLLQRECAANPGDAATQRQRRYASAVIEGVRDLDRTVSGLLEFTRARRLERRAVAPGDLARSCLDHLAAEAEHDDAREHGSDEDPLPRPRLVLDDRWRGGDVQLDQAQLRQVLLNLLQNAVHALQESSGDPEATAAGANPGEAPPASALPQTTHAALPADAALDALVSPVSASVSPDSAPVTAASAPEPARTPGTVRLGIDQRLSPDGALLLVFTIDDNGPGIPADQRAQLFTPFHTTRSQGTGLGLCIAQTIVALHGGSIAIDDSPLGGARFVVALPA